MSRIEEFLRDLQRSSLEHIWPTGRIVAITRQMYFWDFPDMIQQILKDNV